MHIENTSTPHPLRTILLRFDRSVTPPAFETQALALFHELHDRTWTMLQRIKKGRAPIASFRFSVEEVEELFEEAQQKFRHLEVMIPENPHKETVRTQLRNLLVRIDDTLRSFVPELSKATLDFWEYDDYMFQEDEWLHEIALPEFDKIFKDYKSCSVDMTFFDRDLDDLKGVLSFVKRQEKKYYEEMNQLVDWYSDLNYNIDTFFEQVDKFDSLLTENLV